MNLEELLTVDLMQFLELSSTVYVMRKRSRLNYRVHLCFHSATEFISFLINKGEQLNTRRLLNSANTLNSNEFSEWCSLTARDSKVSTRKRC